jgi:hypothetical protein
MTPPPKLLDGAKVLQVASLTGIKPTGATRHFVKGEQISSFVNIALARYEDQSGIYLFYCDEDWNVITDTYHSTVDDAIGQAEYEFGRLVFTPVKAT